MQIQKILDGTTKGYSAKFVTDIENIEKYKEYLSDRSLMLNRYFEKFGFSGINEGWKKITRKNAEDCLTYIISKSIPYQDEVYPENKALSVAREFLNNFSSSAKIFTNVSPYSWEPVFALWPSWSSDWNYEDYEDESGKGYLSCVAVIAYDEKNIGILCKLESD